MGKKISVILVFATILFSTLVYAKNYNKSTCYTELDKYYLNSEKESTMLRKKDFKSAFRYAKRKYNIIKKASGACKKDTSVSSKFYSTVLELKTQAKNRVYEYEDAGY